MTKFRKMKILSISYHPVSHTYGISQNPAGVFSDDPRAEHFTEEGLEKDVTKYLIDNKLHKRRVGLYIHGQETKETNTLVDIIVAVNPKAERI